MAKRTRSSLDKIYAMDAQHSREVAVSAGEIRRAVAAEVDRILSERPNNQLKAASAGLQRLAETHAITTAERRLLNQICDFVFTAQRGRMRAEDATAKIRRIYNRLVKDKNATPVAIAIASIAASGSVKAPGRVRAGAGVMARASRSDTIDAGMVGGAIGGAVIGGAIGGFVGAGLGAVIGGVAGGIGAACAS